MSPRATAVVRLERSLAHTVSAAVSVGRKTSLRYGFQDRGQRATPAPDENYPIGCGEVLAAGVVTLLASPPPGLPPSHFAMRINMRSPVGQRQRFQTGSVLQPSSVLGMHSLWMEMWMAPSLPTCTVGGYLRGALRD